MSTFLGVIDAKGRIVPDFPGPLHAYLLKRFGVGACIEFEVREQGTKRTDRQNKALHALITEWARHRGETPDALKQWVKAEVFGTVEIDVQGHVFQVLAKPHSSRLSIAEFCHLIEEVLRLAAEDGCWLQAPDEYRKAKEKAARQAA